MRLTLVRHGQTEWNIAGRAQGHTDIPLDATGLAQAAALGEWFENRAVERVLVSDLRRAIQTAEPIVAATGAKLEVQPLLRERCFGEWEGRAFTEVAALTIENRLEEDVHSLQVRPPNGESFADVWHRVGHVVDRLFSEDKETVVVTHGGTLSILLARLLKGNLETCRGFRFANTSITELERRPEGLFMMSRFNETPHLRHG